jgi:hypothetical protein
MTYANVVATLALLFAMSGGALAAKHYLINSTKQINPKVLRKLHGARGPRGTVGPNGAIGPQGVQGIQGRPGNRGEKGDAGFSALTDLPKGSTESGSFSVSAPLAKEGDLLEGAVTFPIKLAAPIEGQVEVTKEDVPKPMCLEPGTAQKGWLCIYTRSVRNLEFVRAYDPESELEVPAPGRTGKYGFGLTWKAHGTSWAPETEEGLVEAAGTWSVTAP